MSSANDPRDDDIEFTLVEININQQPVQSHSDMWRVVAHELPSGNPLTVLGHGNDLVALARSMEQPGGGYGDQIALVLVPDYAIVGNGEPE